jgi:hypothetical protein
MPEVPSGVTVFFTDVEGSTPLLKGLREAWPRWVSGQP